MNFSKILLSYIILFFSVFNLSFSQTLTNERLKNFFGILLSEKDGLESYVLPEELTLSNRLGIDYQDVKYKFMIGSDIDREIKQAILDKRVKYDFKIEYGDDGFSIVNFTVPEFNYSKRFYFSGGLLISQTLYYARNWKKSPGKYFIVFYSDESEFNDYSLMKLDNFVDSNFVNFNRKNIEQNKIYYFLCKDQNEIEQLTGYKTLGISNLAYDYVISTYNCHYHEVSHILINAELKEIPLYTHPFLQEGFAVAMGGRGGREPYIIHELGDFLAKSGFMDYTELLDRKKFIETDASMSYALSGLYNYFLIRNYYNDYFKLYMKYSLPESGISNLVIDSIDLPGRSIWNEFLSESKSLFKTVYPDSTGFSGELFFQNEKCKIYSDKKNEFYFFRLKDTLLFSLKESAKNYESKKFREIFPNRKYIGEKYLLIARKKELQLYNLFTNNLIANYVSAFELPPREVPETDGWFYFSVKANVFDDKLEQMIISN